MGKFINLTGQRFGRLTAVKRVGTKNGSPLWECICDCEELYRYPQTICVAGTLDLVVVYTKSNLFPEI